MLLSTRKFCSFTNTNKCAHAPRIKRKCERERERERKECIECEKIMKLFQHASKDISKLIFENIAAGRYTEQAPSEN